MGGETSRRSSMQSYEEGTVPQLMNNQHPLKFHSIHGENITMSSNWSVASRGDGFCKGIVFSHRPVLVNEYIYVKFLELSSSWSGGLRIGFTANDPNSYKNKLPKYACPCMTDLPGNWARAIAERFVQQGSVLFYYVDQNGDVHYGLNNEEKGIFFSGVNVSGKLWALMDIYGNTIQIELLADPHRSRNTRKRPGEELCNNEVHTLGSVAREAIHHNLHFSPQYFHEKHGMRVALDHTRTIATYDGSGLNHGFIFTDSPITLNDFYVIRLSECERNEEMVYGLTSCDPSNLITEDLPYYVEDVLDRLEYWIVHKVEKCQQSDILAFVVNNNGAVKYSRNGSPLITTLYVDHTLNLWFFFYVDAHIRTIQFEGVCKLPDGEVLTHLQSLQHHHSNILLSDLESEHFSPSSSQSPSEGSNECVICYEADKNTALYRCGHVCTCFSCATHLFESSKPQCPVCREVILDVIKLYK